MRDFAEERLREHGIKPSHHRLKVLEYMLENRNHPSADMIYKALAPEIPTLSKTTVYNTVELFLEKGVVQPIMIAQNELRYDADTSFHGHFLCRECGKIYDFFYEEGDFPPVPEGYLIEESHAYYRGVCPECRTVKQ